jgi:hypothetical protein
LAIAIGNAYSIDSIGVEDFKNLCDKTAIAWALINRVIIELAESLLNNINSVNAEVADKGFASEAAQLTRHIKAEVSARASLFA